MDDPVVWYEGAVTTSPRYLHSNHQGSVVAVTDSTGNATAINSYDGAAGVAEQQWGIPSPLNQGRFQYTGQAWIPELKIYYYKARIYSPTLGRFLQTDPIGYDDQVNLYAYVGNDPVNNVDPTGLRCDDPNDSEAYCDPENPDDDAPPIDVKGNCGVMCSIKRFFDDKREVPDGREEGDRPSEKLSACSQESEGEIVVCGLTSSTGRAIFEKFFGRDDPRAAESDVRIRNDVRNYCQKNDLAGGATDLAGAASDISKKGSGKLARAIRGSGKVEIYSMIAKMAFCTRNGY